MSTEPDFVYVSEKVAKDGQDYEINLLSPDDFEIIRPRCDIPSPLQCSLEDGVGRQLSNQISEPGPSPKSRQVVGEVVTSCEQEIDKQTELESEPVTESLASRFDCQVSGTQLEVGKVVRPIPSYGFSIARRKDSEFEQYITSQEVLGLSLVATAPTTSSSDIASNAVNYKDNSDTTKRCDLNGNLKNLSRNEGPSNRSSRDSSGHQNALVIVTPPGFKVGSDSLPAVKSVVGPHTTIFCNSNSCRDVPKNSRGSLISPSFQSSAAAETLPVTYRKIEPLHSRISQNDTKVVLLDPKCSNVVNSDITNENTAIDSERLEASLDGKLDRTSQDGIIWKSGVLLSRTVSGGSDADGEVKTSEGDASTFETRDISCLSPDGCYGVNVVIDDSTETVPQCQSGGCQQHGVAILEGYDQPLAVSGGLLNNSTVSEQTFLQITSMNNDTDSSPNDRMSREVVITQHVLSLPQLYSCQWEGCNTHLLTIDDLISHAISAHVKPGKDQQYCCHWQGCQRDGRTFNARYKMLIHLRTHTGEKPHVCPMEGCGKSFSRMENLKIHMRCHTGEKPYKCPYDGCGKSYSNSSDRFKHTKTHYEKKPYRCKYEGCQKSYTDPSSLRKHHKSHRTKVALSVFVQSGSTAL